MKRMIGVGIVLAGLVGGGCDWVDSMGTGNRAKDKDGPATRPADPVKDKNSWQGRHLTIRLDGKVTERLQIRRNRQIWSVPPCSGTPILWVRADTDVLGEVQSIHLIIKSYREGRLDPNDQWIFLKEKTLAIGKEIPLDQFEHIVSGKIVPPKTSVLPKGTYQFVIQVYGQKGWDRQYIYVKVQ